MSLMTTEFVNTSSTGSLTDSLTWGTTTHYCWSGCGCYPNTVWRISTSPPHEHDYVQAAGERLLFCRTCGDTKWLPKPKRSPQP